MRIHSFLRSSLLKKDLITVCLLCTSSFHCKWFPISSFWDLWKFPTSSKLLLHSSFQASVLLPLPSWSCSSLLHKFPVYLVHCIPILYFTFLSAWISQILAEMKELPMNHTCCMCKNPSVVQISPPDYCACWIMKILFSSEALIRKSLPTHILQNKLI